MLARVAIDLAPPAHDPATVRGAARQILQRPEFLPPHRGLLQAAWHWLATQLGKWLGKLFGGGGFGSSWQGDVVVGVVVAVAVGAVLLAVARRARGGRVPRPPGVVVRAHGPDRSAAEWRAEAAAHEAAGRWRDALRCRYRALVAELAGRGVVDEIPGRTSGEYRGDVNAAVPAAGPAFDGATELFEQAWYGDRATTREEQAAFDDLARRVLAPAGARPESWDVARGAAHGSDGPAQGAALGPDGPDRHSGGRP